MRYYCESCGRFVAEMTGQVRSGTDVIMYCRECSEPVHPQSGEHKPGDLPPVFEALFGKFGG